MLTEDDVFDMANLTSRQTGIDGTVFISTVMGQHGPRVKYFEKTGKGQPSFSVSIAAEPVVVSSNLPERVVNRMAPRVIAWVRLNRQALLDFWNEGQFWPDDEVAVFKAALKRLDAAS